MGTSQKISFGRQKNLTIPMVPLPKRLILPVVMETVPGLTSFERDHRLPQVSPKTNRTRSLEIALFNIEAPTERWRRRRKKGGREGGGGSGGDLLSPWLAIV